MVKNIFKLFIFVLIIFLISSCATTISRDKLTSDDCLVLVKTKIENPDKLKVARTYRFNITDFQAVISVPKKEESIVYIKIRNDSTYIEAISSNVTDKEYTGTRSKDESEFLLPYAPGEVVVADFIFIQTIKKISSRKMSSSISFEQISSSEKDSLLKINSEDSNFDSWWD